MSRDHSLKVVDIRTFQPFETTLDYDDLYLFCDHAKFDTNQSERFVSCGSKNGGLVFFDLDKMSFEEMYDGEHTTGVVAVGWQKIQGNSVASIDTLGNLFIWE